MTDIDEAKRLWRLCASMEFVLSVFDRAQIANSLRAMIAKAEQADEFEAFKRDVSDAVEEYVAQSYATKWKQYLGRFIIAKPDPLVEAYQACFPEDTGIPSICAMLQAEITKRGGKIVWENEP